MFSQTGDGHDGYASTPRLLEIFHRFRGNHGPVGFGCIEIASAAPIRAPTVDKLTVHVLVDSSLDLFARPTQAAGVTVAAPPRTDARANLHSEWGLSLFLTSQRSSEQRTFMLDFGYSSPVLLNNIEVIGVDPGKIDALIVSHGHFDHFGGLQGFLNKYRNMLPTDVRLYAGGEDNFCHRLVGPQNELTDFGTLDRRELAAQRVTTVLCETPTVIAGHAFTTGKIARSGIEHWLRGMGHDRGTSVQSGIADAIFQITGKRYRDLPFRNRDLTWS